jgi:hypothetical protein
MIEDSPKRSHPPAHRPAKKGAIGVGAGQMLIGAKLCNVWSYGARCKPHALVK